MPTALEREAFFTQELVNRYGADYGITAQTVNRVFDGTATDAERLAYVEGADRLVMRFKTYLRTTPIDSYTQSDVDVVMAMMDANHRYLESGSEPLGKVIPEDTVARWLTYDGTGRPPAIAGFAALARHSDGLSPQQTVSQFGLDYTDSSFIVKDGASVVSAPVVFSVTQPMSPELQQAVRIPVDPRLLAKIEATAASDSDPARRARASDFLTTYRPRLALIVRDPKDEAAVRQRYPGYDIQKAADAPYLGTSTPMFGATLAAGNPYAAVMMEHYMVNPPPLGAGTVLTMKIARKGGDPNQGDRPAGADTVEVGRWDGKAWKITASPADLERAFERALSDQPPAVAAKFRAQLQKATSAAPLPVPAQVKKHASKSWSGTAKHLGDVGELRRPPLPREVDRAGGKARKSKKLKKKT